MDIINDIRCENGFDETDVAQKTMSTIEALQGNINRALIKLSDEMYSKSTHFLLEFIQNADDNEYAANVTPTLTLKLEGRRIHIKCNEVGFNEANVRAICKIGVSTKKDFSGYIGEKGIGFKSVFKVADVVYIASGPYKFKLDRREKLGMITPIWTSSLPVPVAPGCTTFVLQLSNSTDTNMLSTHFKEIKPSLLLFLQKLRSVTIDGPFGQQGRYATIKILRDDIDANVVNLTRMSGKPTTEKYFKVTHTTGTYTEEERRKNVTKSEIILAFPLTEDEEPIIDTQPVHAFLPLRSYGFTFIIQADFLVSTNREDILFDLEWNITLRDAISAAFLDAVRKFKARPTLEFTWFKFLPQNIHDSFFKQVESRIISELSEQQILRSAGGEYHLPSKFIISTPSYCDADDQPLIPEAHLPGGRYYLSRPYNLDADEAQFLRLGVQVMSDEHFLNGLKDMRSQIRLQSVSWHEAVCERLCMIPNHKGKIRVEIQKLAILPLSDMSWVDIWSTSNIFFHSKLADIPQDLGLRLLIADIPQSSWRYRLFERLGVREADSKFVANQILACHQGRSLTTSVRSLITHALFMFVHRHAKGFPRLTGFRVMDEQGAIADPQDIYADIPDPHQSLRMHGVLPPPARFLHPDYLQEDGGDNKEDWQLWLRNSLGLNIFPRIVGGQLSPEFMALVSTVDTRSLMIILKESWKHWSGRLQESALSWLSRIPVTCQDGSTRMMKTSYLPRESLTYFPDIPFLPIDKPDDTDWNFLEVLGVTLQEDGTFYLMRLKCLRDEGSHDEEMIEYTYHQIQSHFYGSFQNIRKSFLQEHLIYHKPEKRWIAASATAWDGPPSITSKIFLKEAYPQLEKLFHVHLEIPIAGPNILANELQELSEKWKGRVIQKPVKNQILLILADIADVFSTKTTKFSPPWLRKLAHEAIFPAEIPFRGTMLCTPEDFYIPDKSRDLLVMFSDDVPFLSLSELVGVQRIQPLLESDLFKPRLKFIEKLVKHIPVEHGPRLRDSTASPIYAKMSSYVKRYIYGSGSPPKSLQAVEDFLTKLKNITVYHVDSIESTYKLESFVHRKREDVTLKSDETKLSVLISKQPQHDCDLLICAELAKLLPVNIPTSTILLFVTGSADMIEKWFKMEGIAEINDNNVIDCSWLQGTTGTSQPQSQPPAAPASPPGNQKGSMAKVATSSGTDSSWRQNTSRHTRVQSHTSTSSLSRTPEGSGVELATSRQPLPPTVRHPQVEPGSLFDNAIDRSWSERHVGRGTPQSPSHRASVSALSGINESRTTSQLNVHTFHDPQYGFNPNNSADYSIPMMAATSYDSFSSETLVIQSGTMSSPPPSNFHEATSPPNWEPIPLSSSSAAFTPSFSLHPMQPSNGPPVSDEPLRTEETHNTSESTSTGYDRLDGIAGEYYIYDLLSKELPEFGPDNWTSELRNEVPGFMPYTGDSIADFVYLDFKGALTGLLYGQDQKDAWKDRWPKFYLEVKSTSRAQRDVFHMSRNQVETALRMTNVKRDDTDVPEEVYAIIRVSGVRMRETSSCQWTAHPDPHRLFFEGRLLNVSNSIDVMIAD